MAVKNDITFLVNEESIFKPYLFTCFFKVFYEGFYDLVFISLMMVEAI